MRARVVWLAQRHRIHTGQGAAPARPAPGDHPRAPATAHLRCGWLQGWMIEEGAKENSRPNRCVLVSLFRIFTRSGICHLSPASQNPRLPRSTAAPPPPWTPRTTPPVPKNCISGKPTCCSFSQCNFQEPGGMIEVTAGALKMERREGQYRQAVRQSPAESPQILPPLSSLSYREG